MSASTASDKRYMGKVAERCCELCRFLDLADDTPCVVHHLRTGQGKMRAKHTDTFGLCPHHHQFSGFGVHDMGRDEFEAMYGISEVGLLRISQQALGHPSPIELEPA